MPSVIKCNECEKSSPQKFPWGRAGPKSAGHWNFPTPLPQGTDTVLCRLCCTCHCQKLKNAFPIVHPPPFFPLCASKHSSPFFIALFISIDFEWCAALFCNKDCVPPNTSFHPGYPRRQSASKYFVPIIPFQQCGKSDQWHCLIIVQWRTQ